VSLRPGRLGGDLPLGLGERGPPGIEGASARLRAGWNSQRAFLLFMALLDGDRFEGRFCAGPSSAAVVALISRKEVRLPVWN
jgi:hypothetical protein